MYVSKDFADELQPDPYINLVDFSNQYRYLPKASSIEPGLYRTSRVPYVEEIMLELSVTSPTQEIVFVKPTQIGATEIANNFLFYIARYFPGPAMMAFPTDAMAKKHSKKKITPSVDAMPCLSGIISEPKSRDGGNTILLKEFPGGSWTFTGSNSPTSARSDSIRYLILDDIDGFVYSAGEEGSPIDLFKNRCDAFGSKKKIYINSTPTRKGLSAIEIEYNQSSMGRYFVPCPFCGSFQYMAFDENSEYGIKFDAKTLEVWLVCNACKEKIFENKKTWMLLNGKYIHDDPLNEKRGFKINSFYSPTGLLSWKDIIKGYLKSDKNKQKRQVWINTRLADTYEEEGLNPDWEILQSRSLGYQLLEVPEQVLILCAGIDTQDNRLAFVVRGFGYGEESWLVSYGEIWGDPAEQETWEQLDQVLNMKYLSKSNKIYSITSVCIDSGGHRTQETYNYCRFRYPRIIPIKGASTPGKPAISKPNRVDVTFHGATIKQGVTVWTVGSDTVKALIYSRLKLKDGPGAYHWPEGLPEDYYLQLTAEKQMTVFHNGYPRLSWQKIRERNEALDCEVYCYSAAVRAGIAFMQDRQSEQQEEQQESRKRPSPQKSNIKRQARW